MNDAFPRWPIGVCGLVAAVSGGTCLALGIDLSWAVLGTTAVSGLVLAWIELSRPRSAGAETSGPQLRAADVDEEVVRRLEALAARMREELEARRASPAS